MKIALTQFTTLDGVTQGPGAPDEDVSDGFTRGGWFVPCLDEQFVRCASRWLDEADGLLFGRRTYQAFARDWPRVTDPRDPFAERMNTLPKYVATETLDAGQWHPTTVLRGEATRTVAELKARPGRELQIHGSARLAGRLLAAGLVDTVRLAVAPVVLGQGRRLFGPSDLPAGLRLDEHEVTGTGLLLLSYTVVGEAATAYYAGAADLT